MNKKGRKINTPPDNYEPNTIGNQGMTMEQIQQQRNNDVPQPTQGAPSHNSI
mgnify:CR=1 FL=1